MFHSPQPLQRPDQVSDSWPQAWQKKEVAERAIGASLRTAADVSTGASRRNRHARLRGDGFETQERLVESQLRCSRRSPLPAAAQAFDPALEAKNFAKTGERMQYVTLTPEFQLRLQQANIANLADAVQIPVNDPERNFTGNVCANGGNECAGDVRFYDWKDAGFGIVKPVLFTARNGSTLSGPRLGDRAGAGSSGRRS